MEIATLCLKLVQNVFKSNFLSVGHAAGAFFFRKVDISGFGGHAQFEDIALLLIFGHIWLQIEIAMSLFLRPSLK